MTILKKFFIKLKQKYFLEKNTKAINKCIFLKIKSLQSSKAFNCKTTICYHNYFFY